MSGSVNRVTLAGNLGHEPELRHMKDGRAIVSFSIATSERWTAKDGERKERTEWNRVVILHEGLVKIANRFLRKGSRIFVEGRLQTRKWQDREGRDRYTTEVVLTGPQCTLTLLDPAPDRRDRPEPEERAAPPAAGFAAPDDLPF